MSVVSMITIWAMIGALAGGGGWDLYRRIRSLAHRSLADELLRMTGDGCAIWLGVAFANLIVFKGAGFAYFAGPAAVLMVGLSLGCWGTSRIIGRRDWIADKRRRAEFGQVGRKKLWKPATVAGLTSATGLVVAFFALMGCWPIGEALYPHPTNDDVSRVVHVGLYVVFGLLVLTGVAACAMYWRQVRRIAAEDERIAAADAAFLAGEPPAADAPAGSGGHA